MITAAAKPRHHGAFVGEILQPPRGWSPHDIAAANLIHDGRNYILIHPNHPTQQSADAMTWRTCAAK